MNLRNLEQATAVLAKIKVLDAEIIELDKFAMMIANGEIKSSFDLKLLDLEKQEKEENKQVLDEDGSIIKMKYSDFLPLTFNWSAGASSVPAKNPNEHTLSNDLSELVALQVMGVMLCDKQEKRTKLIKQLNSYGIHS